MTSITYPEEEDLPSGVEVTGNVSYGYDNVGNRSSMTDGLGSKSYSYDELSRMTSETRSFTGLSGSYAISYTYNLAGELSSITDQTSATINYARDNAGHLTAVTGTILGGITYTSNIQYCASGAIKHWSSGDSTTMDASFNERGQASDFTVSGKIDKTYDYNDDGTLRFSSDLLDHRFDRYYSFDQMGRLKEAFTGQEARGGATTANRPYKQTYSYDAFSHLTERTGKIWWTSDYTMSDSYVNNRRVDWQYDSDGRLLHSAGDLNTYDAAGRNINVESYSSTAALG